MEAGQSKSRERVKEAGTGPPKKHPAKVLHNVLYVSICFYMKNRTLGPTYGVVHDAPITFHALGPPQRGHIVLTHLSCRNKKFFWQDVPLSEGSAAGKGRTAVTVIMADAITPKRGGRPSGSRPARP